LTSRERRGLRGSEVETVGTRSSIVPTHPQKKRGGGGAPGGNKSMGLLAPKKAKWRKTGLRTGPAKGFGENVVITRVESHDN